MADAGVPPADDTAPWHDAGLAACWAYDAYRHARTPIEAADFLVELNNRMYDLATYLPGFDVERGWLRDEDDEVSS